MTTSTLTSSGMLSAFGSTSFTLKSRFSSSMKTHGWFAPLAHRIIIGSRLPITGSELITPTTGFVRRHDARDGARDVVFEQALALGAKERDRFLLIEQADAQAEINRLAVERSCAFDAVELGGIFRVGIRLGIELLDFDLPFEACRIFAEQIVDSLRVGLQKDRHTARALACSKTESAPAYRASRGSPVVPRESV